MNFDANGNAINDADPVSSQALSLGAVSDGIGGLLQSGLSIWQQVESIKATKQENRLAQAQQTQANSVAAAASTSGNSSGLPKWVVWGAVGLGVVGLGWLLLKKS